MNIRVSAFVNATSTTKVERNPTYTAIRVGGHGYGSDVILFFDTEETLQNFIAVINANKEDASVD